MTASNPALLPDPPLFDVTDIAKKSRRRAASSGSRSSRSSWRPTPAARSPQTGSTDSPAMLMRTGQLVPCIGYRPDRRRTRDRLRRPAAATSPPSAATSSPAPKASRASNRCSSLIVLLLDHEPTADEIRRIQAIANNAREKRSASSTSKTSSRDCWQARAGLDDEDRIAAVCADLGISAKKAHNLRRQLTLPEPDPRPGRRAPRRRAAVGDDGQPARRPCTRSPPS